MAIKEYVPIGQFVKSHGLIGVLRVGLKPGIEVILNDLNCIFIREGGQMLPLFLEYIEVIGTDYAFKIEDIDQPQDASQLAAREIFVDKTWLSSQPSYQPAAYINSLDLQDMVGFSIIDVALSEPLIIDDIQEFPQQIMAIVTFNSREIFLPLSDSFIVRIDHKQKKIWTEFPEGIFDL